MIRKSLIISISILSILFCISSGHTQNLSYAPNFGISKAVGEESEYWKAGFSVGANLFYSLSNNFLLGGRIAYNRLSPNGEKIFESYYNDYTNLST